jgi:hypothetical protein
MNGEQTSKKPAFRKLRGYAFDPSLSFIAGNGAGQ